MKPEIRTNSLSNPIPTNSTSLPKLPETNRSTSSPVLRVTMTMLLVGLLVGAVILNRPNAQKVAGESGANVVQMNPADAKKRYGFVLTEAAREAGIDFTHVAPMLDSKLSHIRERVADMGAGIAVSDFDGDGDSDFYVTNSGENSKNALFVNDGSGKFTNEADQYAIADLNQDNTGVSMGALWGDMNNDGREDLLVYKWGRARLFQNNGANKPFTDVTEKSGLPRWMNANTAVLFDYDGDGKLDMLLAGYFDEKLDLWNLASTKIMPDSLEYATNGTRKYLLKGGGDFTFADTTASAGINTNRWSLAVAVADLRGTGKPDLFIANDYGYSELWLNNGNGTFRDVSKDSGIGASPKSGMNASFGDVNNTGKAGIYVSNITEEHVLLQENNFWSPTEATKNGAPVFENLAGAYNIGAGGWSFGAQFGDLNNDGFQDLYLVNGYISGSDKTSYWFDYQRVSGGNASIIGDAANWIPIKNRSLSGYQRKRVWLNDGAGKFSDIAQAVGVTDVLDGRSIAYIDTDNDGDLDVLVGNQRGPVLFYRNDVDKTNAWVGIKLVATKSNRSGIGAQVRVFFDKGEQVQEVHGGVGFCAQNQRALHFGLGKGAKLEKIIVRWPSGVRQTIPNAKLNEYNIVREPS